MENDTKKLAPRLRWLASRAQIVVHFFTAQGITMAGNLLYGLICMRLLPPSEYAKFVLILGVQGTLLILMDANFSGTLMPLVGERVGNLKLIADYVVSLRQLSIRAYLFVACGTIILFPLLVKHRNWTAATIAGMIAAILISTWFLRVGSAYGTVLILLRDRNTWYRVQLTSSLGTLAILGVFWYFKWIGPFQVILVNVTGMIYTAAHYYYRSRKLLGLRGEVAKDKKHAIVRLALPNMPASMFFAFQGQISLFLITFLGQARGMASVGALGRLSQLFSLFLQANGLLVEPYFAKLPKEKLRRSYAVAVVIACALALSCVLFTFQFPRVFVWLLGPQYGSLVFEIRLAVGTSAISCVSGVLWGINSARRFVYWWNVMLSIGLTLLVQVVFFITGDMGTVRGVLWLNFATNLVSLFVNLLSGGYGLWRGPRATGESPTTDIEVPELEGIVTEVDDNGGTPRLTPGVIHPHATS